MTDEQWALIEPHIPVYPGGRPRTTDLREVVDAVFYVLRAGCQWRHLPKDFPPKSTVWRSFDEWRHNGTLDTLHDLLRRKVRTAEKPYSPRTTASVDSQSVDTSEVGTTPRLWTGGSGTASSVRWGCGSPCWGPPRAWTTPGPPSTCSPA